MTTDKGGEDPAGHPHPSAAPVGRTGRISEAAGQRIREGDQAEGARGQRGAAGWYRLLDPPKRPQFHNHRLLSIPPAAQQTEQRPGAAVPAPGSDSPHPGGRDVPPGGAAGGRADQPRRRSGSENAAAQPVRGEEEEDGREGGGGGEGGSEGAGGGEAAAGGQTGRGRCT